VDQVEFVLDILGLMDALKIERAILSPWSVEC